MGTTRRARQASRELSRRSAGTPRLGADPEILRQIAATVRRAAPGAEVILYGSRARGDAEPDSDYDVLVLVDEPGVKDVYRRIHGPLYDLAVEQGVVVSLVVENRRTWESPAMRVSRIYQSVRRDGRSL